MQEGIFKTLKALRHAYASLPGISSCRDYGIMTEVGYRQETGNPLTLKQLLPLNIASHATVRRHLRQLVGAGMVVRCNSCQYRREVHLELSPRALAQLRDHCRQVMAIVRAREESGT